MGETYDVSIDAQVACVERELRMRERVYPRWVSAGRMTPNKAREERVVMEAVLRTLQREQAKGRLL